MIRGPCLRFSCPAVAEPGWSSGRRADRARDWPFGRLERAVQPARTPEFSHPTAAEPGWSPGRRAVRARDWPFGRLERAVRPARTPEIPHPTVAEPGWSSGRRAVRARDWPFGRLERPVQPARTPEISHPTVAEPGWSSGRRAVRARDWPFGRLERAVQPARSPRIPDPTAAEPGLQPGKGPDPVSALDLGFLQPFRSPLSSVDESMLGRPSRRGGWRHSRASRRPRFEPGPRAWAGRRPGGCRASAPTPSCAEPTWFARLSTHLSGPHRGEV